MPMLFKLFCGVLMAALLFTPSLDGGEIVLAGSSTVQKRLLIPAADAIEKATGVKIKVLAINSIRGFKELEAGKVTASISSRPLQSLLEKSGMANIGLYKEHVITRDVLVPIVHPSNPISALSWKQLGAIFCGDIINWKELGGPEKDLFIVVPRKDTESRKLFKDLVLKAKNYTVRAKDYMSQVHAVDVVIKFDNAITFVSPYYVSHDSKVIKAVKTLDISRPLSIITKGKPSGDVKKVLDFLQKAENHKFFRRFK